MTKNTDLWTYLSKTEKNIVMYGMGNGADKILSVCERHNIEIKDFFASDGFVRGHCFRNKRVLSYSEVKEKYGSERLIVLLSFASSLPEVLENIYRIASECELYAPDVPVSGSQVFDGEFYAENEEKIKRVEGLLCDDISKEIYRNVVDFKLLGDVMLLKNCFSDISEVYKTLGAENFEYIADLGAYNGDTLREILPYAPRLKEAIAFEPDKRSFKKLSEYAKGEERASITPIAAAAWSRDEILLFDGSGNRNSNLYKADGIEVSRAAKVVETEARALDGVLGGKRVDYIKYDVEGSEKEAVEGSFETIGKYMPALAVSLYHRSEDIFTLPLLIHEKFPDYKLYIRRREYIPAWDTILLAVKK